MSLAYVEENFAETEMGAAHDSFVALRKLKTESDSFRIVTFCILNVIIEFCVICSSQDAINSQR